MQPDEEEDRAHHDEAEADERGQHVAQFGAVAPLCPQLCNRALSLRSTRPRDWRTPPPEGGRAEAPDKR